MKLQVDDLGVCGVIVEDWDIEKSFKPKTITTDYSSWIAYISRKAVPANTPITNSEYWKPLTRLQSELAFNYNKFKDDVTKQMYNLTLLVNTFLESTEHGMAIANELGDGEQIAVNQKTITRVINDIYSRLEDMTGDIIQGISMVVTPEYYIGEDGATVTVSASSADANGKFEDLYFTVNGQLVGERVKDLDYYSFTTQINETSVIDCYAKILGVPYHVSKTVVHYNSFWLGAGNAYTDIMDVAHTIPITNGMRGAYDVNVAEGNHLFIIIGESLRSGFLRADINSIEIPFTESTVTINGNNYIVFTSENAYMAGTYNIDVNG